MSILDRHRALGVHEADSGTSIFDDVLGYSQGEALSFREMTKEQGNDFRELVVDKDVVGVYVSSFQDKLDGAFATVENIIEVKYCTNTVERSRSVTAGGAVGEAVFVAGSALINTANQIKSEDERDIDLNQTKFKITRRFKDKKAVTEKAKQRYAKNRAVIRAEKSARTRRAVEATKVSTQISGAAVKSSTVPITMPIVGVLLIIAMVGFLIVLIAGAVASSRTSRLSGNEAIIANYLLDKGLDELHVAAIMGNIQAESGYTFEAVEGGNGIGHGICQWSFGRWLQLETYSQAIGKSWTDAQTQLDFLWAELTGQGPAAAYAHIQYDHNAFLAITDLDAATLYFQQHFERAAPSAASTERRLAEARRVYGALVSGGTGDGISTGILSYPLPEHHIITSGFGPRWGVMHRGVDFGAPAGTPILAADGGAVIAAATGWNGGQGNFVRIDHGNGLQTVYMHASSLATTPGSKVSKGQVIAYVGTTGDSTGNHLHFQVEVGGAAVDPMSFI